MQRNSFWSTRKSNGETEMSFEWRSVKQGDYKADFLFLKRTFIESFSSAYKNFSETELKLSPGLTKEKFLENAITEELEEMQLNHQIHYLIVKINDVPVGLAICHPNVKTGNVYLCALAVSPSVQAQFGLGRAMIGAIKDRYKDLNGIDLATRVINSGARKFYEKLGFIQKTVGELYLDFSPEKYVGYERSHRVHEEKESKQQTLTRSHSMIGLNRLSRHY